MDIVLLLVGFVLILGGANFMTDGSAAVAKRLGVSDFVIGLTIVSIGTSAPEFIVSLLAAIEGAPAMSIGNIVGSNIFNILMIIGIVAILRPITVPKTVLTGDAIWMLVSSAAMLIVGLAPELGAGPRVLTRVCGLLFVLFFALFLTQALNKPKEASDETEEIKTLPLWRALLYLFGGLGVLVWGGEWFVDGATGLARTLGWSEALIGLTILAVGTSLPELAASITAALKGMAGLSVGTVIGSCIFNVFFVLGCAGTITPMPFGNIGLVDLGVLMLSAVLFLFFGFVFGNKVIKRWEGIVMAVIYIAYLVYLYINI